MSQIKIVSIHNPIIDAMQQLRLDNDKDKPFLTNLATQAEKKIDSYYQYERTRAVLEINNCVACLPSNNVLVEGAIMGEHMTGCGDLFNTFCTGTGNNSVTNVNNQGMFLVVDLAPSDDSTFSIGGYISYYIQNNKMIFNNDGNCGAKITIQYLKYKTDCDGFLEVGENHIEAIKWYIIWMYSMARKDKNYIDRDMISVAREEWNRECRHARAEDNRLTQPERAMVAAMYNDPRSGRSIWQGMHTTLGNFYTIWP